MRRRTRPGSTPPRRRHHPRPARRGAVPRTRARHDRRDAWKRHLRCRSLAPPQGLDPRGDDRSLERVAKAFENSVGRLLPQMDEAFKMNDSTAIMHVAHTLKSSSASIGALKLSHMCAEIETMIRRQTGEDLSSRIREIPLEADRVLDGLRQLLEKQP
ncbi:MAG: Hpt domain-containing protein [Aquabacterium sp.]